MVVRHTLMHLDPENVEKARESYKSEEFTGVLRKLKGYRFNYLLESIDEPGEAISVTAWDTMDDAEAYEQSGLYADLVTKFGKWFTAPAELRTYEVSE
jgi:heme-degrading monooxygenase HmoA